MKILVVDDSEMVRHYYYYILKNAGFDVVSAMDGAGGLGNYAKHSERIYNEYKNVKKDVHINAVNTILEK